jgi:hypothetical protein
MLERAGAQRSCGASGLMLKALQAGASYFALVFGGGFLLGSIRVPFLVPRLGMRTAELIEAPLMFLVILFASRLVVRRFDPAPRAALAVGLVALVLLLAAELLVARSVSGLTIREYISSRDPISGLVYLVLLLIYAALPWLRVHRRIGGSA